VGLEIPVLLWEHANEVIMATKIPVAATKIPATKIPATKIP